MNFQGHEGSHSPMPGSPPELTRSKSSKSSSFHSSYQSDDNGILSETGHFEDIGLDDESRTDADIGGFPVKPSLNPYDVSFANDLRFTAKQRKQMLMNNTTNANRAQRELTTTKTRQLPYTVPAKDVKPSTGLGLLPLQNGTTMSRRGFTSPSAPSLPIVSRNRSLSPNPPATTGKLSANSLKVRRGSWQSNKERKSIKDLERECDEDDGDDLPDDLFLPNIPISPRPPQERTKSVPPSTSTSPERPPKEKIKSVGKGTSATPAEQGVLSPRSPKAPMPPLGSRSATLAHFPINRNGNGMPKARAHSWTAALSELSPEAQALTEALEAHAEDEENRDPQQRGFRSYSPPKQRVKSSIAELPPLRRTDIMIDPHPISKEKEAVLSRTRPSWLPPKNPVEEKRHLKEYQRMMTLSLEAEKKREAAKKARSTCRDDTANSLLRIWEEHVLPNWDHVTSQKRTRELWWRGIAPRSRAAVWTKAIGNQLGLSDSSYTAALRRAHALEETIKRGSQLSAEEERKKRWLHQIEVDAQKTYPELKIFQPGGPLHGSLLDVLKAYAMYRSDIGYMRGTNTIAAVLLLNLPSPSEAFQALSNILNRPLPLSFQTSDSGAIDRTYTLLFATLKYKSPRLHTLLTAPETGPVPDAYLRDVFSSLFTGHLNLDNATRLWDIMVFEGDAVLVRAAIAYLLSIEAKLFGATTQAEVCTIVKEGLQNIDEEAWIRSVRSAGKS